MTEELNRHDVEFLSILAGDVKASHWGAWMTVCGEDLKSMGYVKGLYKITDKGLAYLEMLQYWDHPNWGDNDPGDSGRCPSN
jgi:hypothetical protein